MPGLSKASKKTIELVIFTSYVCRYIWHAKHVLNYGARAISKNSPYRIVYANYTR